MQPFKSISYRAARPGIRLIDWGVDGIITDYPDRLREVMRKRGLALPPGVPR